MLNFIIGTSGSGKTDAVIEAIRRDILAKRRCFLLVPEQQAYISERDLPGQLPQNAGLYFKIVNFSRLAEDVFRAYGGIAHTPPGKGAGAVIMWDTLRRLSHTLMQYGRGTGADMTLTAEMLSVYEELRNNGIESDALEEAASRLPKDSPLEKKLRDLALITAEFGETMRSRQGPDAPDRLIKAAEMLEQNRYFEGCSIYIDSFTSFTAPEFTLITELLRQAESLTVTLCTDSLDSKMMHFEGICETAQRLKALANRIDSPITLKKLPRPLSPKPSRLQILERDLWDFRLTKHNLTMPDPTEAPSIRQLVCSNLYEESEACALNVLGLVQNGMHYGDIALIVRDVDTYKGVLDAALERYGIPYFLSERTELSSKPLSRLILSALRAISHNYRMQDIVTLAKTGLCGSDFRDVALFEEYCETWHINGKRFLDDGWSMNPDGLTDQRTDRGNEILEAANRVRRSVMEPLTRLHTRLRTSGKLTDRCAALYEYLRELSISSQLSEHAKRELSLGQAREAGETVRLYRLVMEALTGLCRLLPDAELTVNEFFSLISLYLSLTDLGSVPNVHDCVVIGAADTLRVENVKASFLLGMCEGEFPKAVSDKGLLTESDKDALEKLGIHFNSRQKLRSAEELFYVYRAMTKPSEKLFLSFPAMQPDGSAKTPSLGFTRVEFLFGENREIFDLSAIQQKNTENTEKLRLNHQAKAVNPNTLLRLSQSSIQAFVSCPYRYYSTYQLKIRSKKDSDIHAADEGNFLHFVFERFLKSALNEAGQLELPLNEEIPGIADRISAEYIEKVCPIPAHMMDARLLHLFDRLHGLALLILQDIVGEIRCGKFRPASFEQRLGGHGENALPPVRFSLTDGGTVELRGTVDRVDLYEKDGQFYVRIVDYKTGEHKFSFDKVRSGDDLQLVLYLFAVVSSDPSRYIPCGAQFLYSKTEKEEIRIGRSGFLLEGDEFTEAADGGAERTYSKGLSRHTLEQLQEITAEMQSTVCSVAQRILAGEATKTPSENACRFCPVIDHCDVACHKKS